jgi:hypothetical protein
MENLIQVTPINDDEERFTFLPALFGHRHMIQGEALVFNWMQKLSRDYDGGLWKFYKLSNGGFYMSPDAEKRFHISSPNGFEKEMSADAAGIIATLYALCHMANMTELDIHIEAYHNLRYFAIQHQDSADILRIID